MILLDVGVWLAAAWARHAQHPAVASWFDKQESDLVLCRVTQMSLLRLLSNRAVMASDVVTRHHAWQVIDRLRADDRVVWADEPPNLEVVWRALSASDDNSHKLWTDHYLEAFARAGGMTLATLDRGLAARCRSVRVEALS